MNNPYQEEWDRLVDIVEDMADSDRVEIAGGDEDLERLLEESDNRIIEELRNM